MALLAKKKTKSSVPPLAADTYPAVCIGVIDLGEQLVKFKEKSEQYLHKILFLFEVIGETVDVDGEAKPRWLSKEYTLSLSEKSKLAPVISAWTGLETVDEYDVMQLVGRPALITVIVKETDNGQYNDIPVITSPPKIMTIPEAESELLPFEIENWNDEVFAKLPEWIQNKIKKSTEYQTKYAPDEKVAFKNGENSGDTGEKIGETRVDAVKTDTVPF